MSEKQKSMRVVPGAIVTYRDGEAFLGYGGSLMVYTGRGENTSAVEQAESAVEMCKKDFPNSGKFEATKVVVTIGVQNGPNSN